MKEFVNAIMSPQEDPLTCRACQDALLDYIDAQTTQQAVGAEFTAVEQHLERCPACADAYRELMELTTLAYAANLPTPKRLPTFDFAALEQRASSVTHKPYWWDEFGRMILEFSADLLALWQPPALAPAYSGLKAGEAAPILARFTIEEHERDLIATVTIRAEGAEGENAGRCAIEVAVEIPSRGGWPNLADIPVMLKRGDEPLARSFTDAFGKVQFTGIARGDLPQLSIEVDPSE
ncbi:MAG: hypothetical protein DCC55_21360 [Chloroflexi bacterium]|nr:MAG: hypothetical protein DCC55_21360 [Chloroflexota bacterium]